MDSLVVCVHTGMNIAADEMEFSIRNEMVRWRTDESGWQNSHWKWMNMLYSKAKHLPSKMAAMWVFKIWYMRFLVTILLDLAGNS